MAVERKQSGIELEIVIPVYNEARILKTNLLRLLAFIKRHHHQRWLITVAINGSSDQSFSIAKALAAKSRNLQVIRLKKKGRGGALKYVWLKSRAKFVAYMDADLSVALKHVDDWLSCLKQGFKIVIGSRNCHGSQVERGFVRTLVSYAYGLIVRYFLKLPVSDCQCGFKVVERRLAQRLCRKTKNNNWFFDTELLFWAHKEGLPIKEFPVRWRERKGSTVKILATSVEDILGITRLRLIEAGIIRGLR